MNGLTHFRALRISSCSLYVKSMKGVSQLPSSRASGAKKRLYGDSLSYLDNLLALLIENLFWSIEKTRLDNPWEKANCSKFISIRLKQPSSFITSLQKTKNCPVHSNFFFLDISTPRRDFAQFKNKNWKNWENYRQSVNWPLGTEVQTWSSLSFCEDREIAGLLYLEKMFPLYFLCISQRQS